MIEKLGVTPGPWDYEEDEDRMSRPFFISHTPKTGTIKYVCELGDNCTDEDGSTEYHNALLIAAAPELLEALIKMEAILEDEPGGWGDFYEMLRAAIFKATNKSWDKLKVVKK